MVFQPGQSGTFEQIFLTTRDRIQSSPGCVSVDLWKDLKQPDTYMTYSIWHAEADLNRYRDSELFKETWSRVKPLFSAPAEVHTMEKI